MKITPLSEYLYFRDGGNNDTIFAGDGDKIEATSSAIAQRIARVPEGTTLEHLTECHCGLLLVPLPRPVKVHRTYAIGKFTFPRSFTLHHAHAATPEGRISCPTCFEHPQKCEHNTDEEVCDLPQAMPCASWDNCGEPVTPGRTVCRPHIPPHGD